MSGERGHQEVVDSLLHIQARLRAESASRAPAPSTTADPWPVFVAFTEPDLEVMVTRDPSRPNGDDNDLASVTRLPVWGPTPDRVMMVTARLDRVEAELADIRERIRRVEMPGTDEPD